MTDQVRLDRQGPVATLTLDRPDRRNALDLAGFGQLADLVRRTAADPSVRCLVLTGSGGSFCAGADVTGGPVGDPDHAEAMMRVTAEVVRVIVDAPVCVIALVDGPAAGMGASLALACDLVLASDQAYFLLPFTGIGLVPDGGATATVAASIGRARALRMSLLGERLSAQAAYDAGLIAAVHPSTELPDRLAAWVRAVSLGAGAALSSTKALINQATLPDLGDALERERVAQLLRLASDEHREGITAFRERRSPAFGRVS